MMLTVTNLTLLTCNINLVLIIGDLAPGFKPRIMYKIVSQNCSKSFTKFKFIVKHLQPNLHIYIR